MAENRKEYKRRRYQDHVSNDLHHRFDDNLNKWLRTHQDDKIEHILQHKPYHITIIWSRLEEVK